MSITYFNRYTQKYEIESVYGEPWLRFAYNTWVGRLQTFALAKRAFFSKWYGWRMSRPQSKARVLPFIEKFGLETKDFLHPPESFKSFNEFFYRRLKPEARPIDQAANAAVFPADGRHLGIQKLGKEKGVFVKNQHFRLAELLGSETLAKDYQGGSLVLSRLCPTDYHRFHFPISGLAYPPKLINGPLYSVNPIALRRNLSYLTQNKRYLIVIESKAFGKVLMLPIGATCVGSMHFTYQAGQITQKGQECGYFAFGGSSTILIFPPNRINLNAELLKHSEEMCEYYSHFGDTLGFKSNT